MILFPKYLPVSSFVGMTCTLENIGSIVGETPLKDEQKRDQNHNNYQGTILTTKFK